MPAWVLPCSGDAADRTRLFYHEDRPSAEDNDGLSAIGSSKRRDLSDDDPLFRGLDGGGDGGGGGGDAPNLLERLVNESEARKTVILGSRTAKAAVAAGGVETIGGGDGWWQRHRHRGGTAARQPLGHPRGDLRGARADQNQLLIRPAITPTSRCSPPRARRHLFAKTTAIPTPGSCVHLVEAIRPISAADAFCDLAEVTGGCCFRWPDAHSARRWRVSSWSRARHHQATASERRRPLRAAPGRAGARREHPISAARACLAARGAVLLVDEHRLALGDVPRSIALHGDAVAGVSSCHRAARRPRPPPRPGLHQQLRRRGCGAPARAALRSRAHEARRFASNPGVVERFNVGAEVLHVVRLLRAVAGIRFEEVARQACIAGEAVEQRAPRRVTKMSGLVKPATHTTPVTVPLSSHEWQGVEAEIRAPVTMHRRLATRTTGKNSGGGGGRRRRKAAAAADARRRQRVDASTPPGAAATSPPSSSCPAARARPPALHAETHATPAPLHDAPLQGSTSASASSSRRSRPHGADRRSADDDAADRWYVRGEFPAPAREGGERRRDRHLRDGTSIRRLGVITGGDHDVTAAPAARSALQLPIALAPFAKAPTSRCSATNTRSTSASTCCAPSRRRCPPLWPRRRRAAADPQGGASRSAAASARAADRARAQPDRPRRGCAASRTGFGGSACEPPNCPSRARRATARARPDGRCLPTSSARRARATTGFGDAPRSTTGDSSRRCSTGAHAAGDGTAT